MLAIACSAVLVACSADKAPLPPAIASTELAAVDTPKPDYPLELACAGISGTTVLVVTIGTEGKPTEVKLAQSSGDERLDKSALERVPSWQFNPPTRNGQPFAQTIQIPVNFKAPAERPTECFALGVGK
ncbi:MAG: energy transducer TonB [Pseudoxanthomonas sp.]